MGKIFKRVLENIDQGMLGMNKGLPMGLPKLSGIINDVQRGRYDLIAAKTSVGKTAFVDQCYVTNPFKYVAANPNLGIKLDILYFSLEIGTEDKITKLLARRLYDEDGHYIDSSALLSRGKDNILPNEMRMTLDQHEEYFDLLEKHVHFYDAYHDPVSIANKVTEFAEENGVLEEKDGEYLYTPYHKNHYVLLIVDTLNLVVPDGKETRNKKDAIDFLSEQFIKFRNICKFTPVVIMQYNANISDPKRIQIGRTEPISDDIEDSKRPSKDCNTYLSLFDPIDMGLTNHRGYNVKRMKGHFRQLQVIKNRDGDRGSRVGMKFHGGIGFFEEIPHPKEMTDADYEDVLII